MGALVGITTILSPLSAKQRRRHDGQLNKGVNVARYEKEGTRRLNFLRAV